MSKRLAFLENLTKGGSKDPMAWYGLAMEYRTQGRLEDSLAAFETLRKESPDYVAMYLMCGDVLSKLGRKDEARSWYEAGIEVARKKGDSHAAGELESALAGLS